MDNVQVIAISGQNKQVYDDFTKIVHKYNRENDIKILEFTDKVPELMHISDIVISKPGGLTTSESLASNLPMIVINPIPGQEEENADFLEKNHLGFWIKKSDTPIGLIFKIITNKDLLKDLKENVKKFARKNSTKDICNILFNN